MRTKKIFVRLVTLLITAVMCLVVIPQVSADTVGLVADWNFDEGLGSLAHDVTSNDNDGFLSGGKFGNALVFDGVSSYVSIPADTTLNIAGPFTVEAWIYRNALGDLDYVLSKDDGPGAPGSNYNLLSFSGDKLALFLKGLIGGAATKGTAYWDTGGGGIVGVTQILVGSWHHVAGVYTGTELRVYLDGVLDGSVTITSGTPYTNAADLWIGNRKYSAGYFNGKIDEVRISNTAITSFDLTVAPTTLPTTVALWHFDESFGTTVYDETSNNNDGTIYGAVWAGPTWVPSQNALRFDGIDDYVSVGDIGVTDDWTIDFSVNIATSSPVIQYPISMGPAGNTYNTGIFVVFNYEAERWGLYDGSTYILGSALSLNTWYQITIIKSGITYRLYRDGSFENSGTIDDMDITNLQFGLRVDPTGPVWPFNGMLRNVKIYNYALNGLNLAFDPTSDAITPVNVNANIRVVVTDALGNTVEGVTVTLSSTKADSSSADLSLSRTSGETNTNGILAFSASSTTTGIYTITATILTLTGTKKDTWTVAVYDPSAGFVTGGGWIYSPAGSYKSDETLGGKATFGFVSKYQKGATVPTGNTEFVFHAAGFTFKSTSYQWLVVAGTKAIFKGNGIINGVSGYHFILTADDGGKTGLDDFRIQIWDETSTIYDNGAQTLLSGGSIVIHK